MYTPLEQKWQRREGDGYNSTWFHYYLYSTHPLQNSRVSIKTLIKQTTTITSIIAT